MVRSPLRSRPVTPLEFLSLAATVLWIGHVVVRPVLVSLYPGDLER
ncbi:MAG: hypothetical protein OXN89_22175 [Bryobacterales bacterium]|nr:hypothetical protein [Bryobacterales bacterium]